MQKGVLRRIAEEGHRGNVRWICRGSKKDMNRRSELNNRGGFSCGGCIVDGVLNNPSEAVRKALRVFNA